ncbi:unnamed protein product [Musa hybrid cultivar]
MDGGINGSQRMSGIGLRWEQGSDIGFWIFISYRVLGLHLLNTFSLPVDGPRGTRGRARKEMMGQNCRRFLRPSMKRWWFLLLLLTQILSPPLLPTADKAHHDIAGASQGGGEGLRN